MASRYAPIEDYGIIGDLHTVALVGRTGRSTSSASRPSTRPRCSPPSSMPSAAAASRSRRSSTARREAALPARHERAAHPLPRRAAWPRCPTSCRWRMPASRTTSCVAPRPCVARCGSPCAATAFRLRPRHATRWSGAARPRFFRRPRRRRRAGAAAACVGPDAGRGRRRRGRFHAARRRVGVVRPRGGDAGRAVAQRRTRLRERGLQGDGELLAPLDRPQHLPGPLARDGEPLGARPEAAHLQRARLDRRRPHVRACRKPSAACATGTTAIPGSATRPSPSTGSCGSATRTRPRRSCAG